MQMCTLSIKGCPPVNPGLLESTDGDDTTWEAVIGRAVELECDEHVYKLMQICHDMIEQKSDSSMLPVYRQASAVVVDYPMIMNWHKQKLPSKI